MTDNERGPVWVCTECIGDEVVSDQIANRGERLECSLGHGEQEVITVEELAEIVDPVYRKYHAPGDWIMVPLPEEIGDHDHVQQGEDPEFILNEMLWCEPEVTQALLEVLGPPDAYASMADGAERMYDSGENYKFVPPSGVIHVQTWARFAERIKHRRRFLDPQNLSDLASIFGEADDVAEAPWLKVETLEVDSRIYRARRSPSEKEAWSILAQPVTELAPPPPSLASAGRMNPAGISVFYGAFEEETAISEVRPWVGSLVVVGGFEPTRELNLLDLSGLGGPGARSLSVFAENYAEDYSRREFLVEFESIVARPVGPHESEVEFLPTQIVAEYVNSVLNLDGIVYGSAQNAGEGTNAVIFLDRDEDNQMPLELVHDSVRTVEIKSSRTEYEVRGEFETTDLAVLFDRLPAITRQWNANQLDMLAAIHDPAVPYEEMAARLHRAVQNAAAVVASMRILADSLDDAAASAALIDVVENYRERLPIVQEIAAAAMTGDNERYDDSLTRYSEITHADRVRPLLEQVFNHERLRAILQAGGLDVDSFISALLGSF